MNLFDSALLKSFAVGFALGCLALVATLGAGSMPAPFTGSVMPAAQAQGE